MEPFVDERRGIEFGGGFQNHNVEKLGITLNLRTERGKELLRRARAHLRRRDRELRRRACSSAGASATSGCASSGPTSIYVSNCGFGHDGPVLGVQDVGPDRAGVLRADVRRRACPTCRPPAGATRYMDHHGGNFMAIAILAALSTATAPARASGSTCRCTEAGATLLGPAVLDYTVNGRAAAPARACRTATAASRPRWRRTASTRRAATTTGSRSSCRDDDDWRALAAVIGEPWCRRRPRYATLDGRLAHEDELDDADRRVDPHARQVRRAGAAASRSACPAAAVQTPGGAHRPRPQHRGVGAVAGGRAPRDGRVRVDGLPVHLSETDWAIGAGRAVPRRAQRPGVRRDPRADRREIDEPTRRGGDLMADDRPVERGPAAPRPLAGLRVVELASEHAAVRRQAARAISAPRSSLVEPPGGTPTRWLRALRRRRPRPRAQPLVVALQHRASSA